MILHNLSDAFLVSAAFRRLYRGWSGGNSIPCQEVRKRELQAVICMQRLGSKTLKWEILQGCRTQHPLQHEGADLSTEVSETNLVDTVVPFI